MNTLTPGDLLSVTRPAIGLGHEGLDVHLINPGMVVEYICPAWVLCRMPDGEEREVHVSALEINIK